MRTILGGGLVIAFALAGCEGARGMLITDDGRMVPATAENVRAETERGVIVAARSAAPADAALEAAIAELPYPGDARRDAGEGWYFHAIHARVLVRSAQPVDRAAVAAAAARPLLGRTRLRDAIHVTVDVAAPSAPSSPSNAVAARAPDAAAAGVVDATAAAAVDATAAAAVDATAAGAVHAGASGERVYAAHAGDTLADLSLAFYGTAEEWRRIRDANPTVDFAALRAGERVVIPPLR